MKTVLVVTCFTLLTLLALPRDLVAQDIVVVNARILDGKGGVIERGSVVVRGGKIVSVAAGPAAKVSGVADDRRAGSNADAGIHRRASSHRSR